MNRADILAKLQQLIEQYLEVQVTDELTEEHRLFDDLSIDSITTIQLIVYIEEEFGLSVPDEGIDPDIFLTIGSFITFIEQLQSEVGQLQG